MKKQVYYERNVYFLLGQEFGKKERALSTLIDSITHSHTRSRDATASEIPIMKFFLGDTDVSVVSEEISGSFLFSKSKIIIISQGEMLGEPQAKMLAHAFREMPKEVYVFFLSEKTRIPPSLDTLFPRKQKRIFWKFSESDYEQYIHDHLLDMNMEMEVSAINLIVHFAGEHSGEIENLLFNFARYAHQKPTETGPGGRQKKIKISQENVEKWLSHYKSESIFSLFEMLSVRRFNEAFTILASLLSSEKPPFVHIAGLVYQLRIALRFKRGREEKKAADRIFASLGIRSYALQEQYKNFTQDIPSSAIESMLRVCERYDARMRSEFDTRYYGILLSTMLYDIVILMRTSPPLDTAPFSPPR